MMGSETVEEESTSFRFQTSNNFKIFKRFRIQLLGMYNSPVRTLKLVEKFYFVNLVAHYSLFDDKASLSLNVSDIFNSQVQKMSTERPFPQVGRLKNDSRRVYLGFSYRFGGNKAKALEPKNLYDNTLEGGGLF